MIKYQAHPTWRGLENEESGKQQPLSSEMMLTNKETASRYKQPIIRRQEMIAKPTTNKNI